MYSAAHTVGMDAAAVTPLQESDLQGWKYFRRLTPLLARLHDEEQGALHVTAAE